jgi:hypothetical protein
MTKFAQSCSRQRPLCPGDEVGIVSRDEILAGGGGQVDGLRLPNERWGVTSFEQTTCSRANCVPISQQRKSKLH